MYKPLADLYRRAGNLYRNFRVYFEPQEVILVSFIPPEEIYDAFRATFEKKGRLA